MTISQSSWPSSAAGSRASAGRSASNRRVSTTSWCSSAATTSAAGGEWPRSAPAPRRSSSFRPSSPRSRDGLQAHPARRLVRGRDGRSLDALWQGSPRAHLGTAVSPADGSATRRSPRSRSKYAAQVQRESRRRTRKRHSQARRARTWPAAAFPARRSGGGVFARARGVRNAVADRRVPRGCSGHARLSHRRWPLRQATVQRSRQRSYWRAQREHWHPPRQRVVRSAM
jgi:hypothetical protein